MIIQQLDDRYDTIKMRLSDKYLNKSGLYCNSFA